jgi:hypothetical protein
MIWWHSFVLESIKTKESRWIFNFFSNKIKGILSVQILFSKSTQLQNFVAHEEKDKNRKTQNKTMC